MRRLLALGLFVSLGCIDFDDRLARARDGGTDGGAPSAGGSSGGSTSGGTAGGISGGSAGGLTGGGATSGGTSGGSTSGGTSGGSTSGGTAGGSTSGGTSGGSTSGGTSGGSTSGGTAGGSTDAGLFLPDGGPFRICDCVSPCNGTCRFVDVSATQALNVSGQLRAVTHSGGGLFGTVFGSNRFVRLARDGGAAYVDSAVAFSGEWRDLDARFGVAIGLSSQTVAFHFDGGWRTTLAPPADPPLTGGVYRSGTEPEAAVYLDERANDWVGGYSVDHVNSSLAPLQLFAHRASQARIRPYPGGGGLLLSRFRPDGGASEPWHLSFVFNGVDGGSTGAYFKEVEMSATELQQTIIGVSTDQLIGTWHVSTPLPPPTLPSTFEHRITNQVNATLRGISTVQNQGAFIDLIVIQQSGGSNGFWLDDFYVPANNEWFVIVVRDQERHVFRLGPSNWVTATLTSPSTLFIGTDCSPTSSGTCTGLAGQRSVELSF